MKKIGRPPKKTYDAKKQFMQLLETVDYIYDCTGEINATATELDMSSTKIKKLLITSGKLEYDETKQIQRLMAYGKKMSEIQDEMGLKKSSINSYLPYSKVPYKDSEISANAERCELYRRRKRAVEILNVGGEDELWNTLVEFEGYVFQKPTGENFKYEIRREKDGQRSIILRIAGKDMEESEYLPWDTVLNVFRSIGRNKECSESSEQSDSCGVSYIFAIFCRFGVLNDEQYLHFIADFTQ